MAVNGTDSSGEPAGHESAEVMTPPSSSSPKPKGGIMATESRFPYQYGSDMHWLWGWGERLETHLSKDFPPSKYDWMLFRPDRLARNTMMRFSIKYPHVIKQIDDYLDFADARFGEFLSDDNESTRAIFANAVGSLLERIKVGVETIVESERAAGHESQHSPPSGPMSQPVFGMQTGLMWLLSTKVRYSGHGTTLSSVTATTTNDGSTTCGRISSHISRMVQSRHGPISKSRPVPSGSQRFRLPLREPRVAVLLVSPDFLASDFIHEHELAPILKSGAGGVRIVWIPIRACSFTQTALKDYQAVVDPKNR